MVDKITFMETLHFVQEIAKACPEPMTKEEVKGYFKDMDLSEEQQEMVYQFLLTPQEAKTGAGQEKDAGREPVSRTKPCAKAPKQKDKPQNPYFQMYLREISAVGSLTKEQKNILYQRLLRGEEVTEEVSRQWLKKIIRIAQEYVTPRVLVEDLVQEGNVSLLLGLGQLIGQASSYGMEGADILEMAQQKRLEEYLEECIREGMESYRRELEGEADSENTILAKVSLLHEARKALAEENGTDPTIQELCDYTRIPQEEITDILTLHERARRE